MKWLANFMPNLNIPLLVGTVILIGVSLVSFYFSGASHERQKWQAKQNIELLAVQQKLLVANSLNRDLERAAVLQAASLKTIYEGKLQDEKAHAASIIADIQRGARRLSVSTRAVPTCESTAGSATTSFSPALTETRAELSDSATADILAIGRSADQAIIESNYVKDLLMQCYGHVESLGAQ
ncbi:MAG: hypothetical protein HOP06_11970 [Methylotenera sp.]|nr:hypothetical protein [Methylotenera sp.]